MSSVDQRSRPRRPRPSPRRAAVVREQLRHLRRRTVPAVRRGAARAGGALRALPGRARRELDRGVRALPGLAVACVVWAVVASTPLWRAFVGSPVWGQCAEELAGRVLGLKLYLGLAAFAVAGYLIGATSVLGTVFLALGTLLVLGLVTRAAYRHTSYARARARFGVDGWADFWDLHREVSAHAVRHLAVNQRRSVAASLPRVPSPRQVGVVAAAAARARRSTRIERLPVTDCGTWLGRSAVGPWWGVPCYAGHRDVVGLIAPPQTGKTAMMIHHVIDHPGAVISTSTKPEVFNYTAALRRARYGADSVDLFNPDNLGGLGSTLRWCVVRGCADSRLATVRAGLLVGLGDGMSEDQRRWKVWAAGVLTGLLMVADLDGRTMTDVAHWVYHPTQREHGAWQALGLMRDTYADRIPEGVGDALEQVLDLKAEKTRDSVFFALRDAVEFMSDPTIAWLCTPARDEPSFDVEAFLDRRGTLYLLGSEDQQAGSAPLLAAFTGHVFATAKNLAAARGGRLDPGPLLSLDEAALITPVPLPSWVADAGGRNITIEWSVQTPSQLSDRWGEAGAKTILNATNALLIFGGLKDDRDLEQVSTWCGKRLELVPDPDDDDGPGHAKYERVPVCSPDLVRLIPQWHALLVHRATRTTLLRFWPGWARRDVRRAGPARGAPLPAPRDAHDQPRRGARSGAEPADYAPRPTDGQDR